MNIRKTVWKCYGVAILTAWIFLFILQLSAPLSWYFFAFLLIFPALLIAFILNFIVEIIIRLLTP
jgi:hypothetical protein